MVRNGLSCLHSQTAATEDMYTAAIVTYAYSWMDSQYATQKANMMEKMETMATKKGERIIEKKSDFYFLKENSEKCFG